LAGSLLDVGCGLGDGLRLMRRNMSRISSFAGTDFSDEAIRKNSENDSLAGIEFFVHDIHQPLERTYDNIICLQTLEHLPEPAVAMNNLINATDGVLIAASPYKNRRPDENHLWSFDETDFADEAVSFLDKRKRNIFWVVDKRPKGARLRRRDLPLFVDKLLARI
ncbi:MAG: methyltransferase domain-containing protein, partial [Phycisphaerales bacterium]|nr:methyltransferase domain-containing protein [Phycisphaerales bacterium]